MLLTGVMMGVEDVKAMGLISKIAPADLLTEHAMNLARRIAEMSPATLKIGKDAFCQHVEMDLPQAYEYATNVMHGYVGAGRRGRHRCLSRQTRTKLETIMKRNA